MQNLEVVQFNGNEIPCILEDGTIWVAIKPIAEAIGINYSSAYNSIKNDEILGAICAIRHTLDAQNRQFKMVCMPMDYINGWLFGISTAKVKPDVKPILIKYKKECYKVLSNHFLGKHREIERNLRECYRLQSEKAQVDDQITVLKARSKAIEKALNRLQGQNFAQLKLDLGDQPLLEGGK